MSFRNKFKVKKDIRQQIEKEEAQQGGRNPRMIPYYKMDEGDKMRLLFVPFENGDLWYKTSVHGPNASTGGIKPRGIDRIGCPREMSGGECSACQKGFDLYAERPDDKKSQEYKELSATAKRFMPKTYTYMSAIVLDSKFEVPESPDGNQVKLISVPEAVEKEIRNMISEGQMDIEDIMETGFILKKTKNDGGFASYETSMFERKPLADDEMAIFEDEDMIIEPLNQYDEELALVIEEPTIEEVEEWLTKAEEKIEAAILAKSGGGDDGDTPRTKRSSLKDKVNSARKQVQEDEPEPEQPDEPEQEAEEAPPVDKKPKSALAAKLAAAKKRKAS